MAKIDIDHVFKTYAGGAQAVRDVSISIRDGEFIVLVGPSGCGKSTLLRMVAGLEEISAGEVRIGGRLVNNVEPAERDIAMVFQNYALYPHMSVRQNLAYGLKNRGTPKPEIEARVAEAARMLELEPYLDRKPRALSGGQRQRVAMGRAIVRHPAAFLFDEPLSNLDAKLRVTMRGEIKRLQRRLGTTSLYVTHDQLEAMTLADRLVVLNKGEIEQIGTPLEIYHEPASTFVASFIGSPAMNLLQGRSTENGFAIGPDLWRLATGPLDDAAITIGFRPEDVTFTRDMRAGPEFLLDYVEELGAQKLVHGTVGGQAVSATATAEFQPQESMRLTVPEHRIFLFSTATGKRLRTPITPMQPAGDFSPVKA
ncbi:MAG: sn-glycerol-3-phosphate ABC transporter ATP-binding protein UgpC [Rhizobiales bacterium 63-7]|nr:sn-glycerol-3-phosphate import ATP-binding protein UgpC [Hyphomicrobiales bacterium]OJU68751.1 MAG: sn-glycerol-3-phosphate ABC transporter ATP-binding protein UgpC [Rhizobiales bacterium 63-7]